MSKPIDRREDDDLDQYPILKKYLSIPDHLKPDDDHPFRKPVLTEEEEDQMGREVLERLKKRFGEKDPSEKDGE